MAKLTKAKAGLVALVNVGLSIRSIQRWEAEKEGLVWAYEAAIKGGLLQSAGFETSVEAEDWLASQEGVAALSEAAQPKR